MATSLVDWLFESRADGGLRGECAACVRAACRASARRSGVCGGGRLPFVKANLHLTRPLIHTMLSTTGHSVPRAPLSKETKSNDHQENPHPNTQNSHDSARPSTRSHTPVQTTQGVQSDDTTLAARCLQNVRRARCQDLVYTPPSPQLPRPKRPHSGRRAFKGASFRRVTR